VVGRLHLIGSVLEAVHNEGHAAGEDKHFAILESLGVALLHEQVVERLQHSRQHVHDKFVAPSPLLEHESEAADKRRQDDVPAVHLHARVLREAKHILKDRDVDAEEQARLHDVLQRLPSLLTRPTQHKVVSARRTLISDSTVAQASP